MINVDELLIPISQEAPCGVDLSFSTEFDVIQTARRFDDPSLDQGEWVTPLKEADWGLVVTQCAGLLQAKSKDVRLAVWLTEALGKTKGFAGLACGYELVARLCDQYWDQLHPLPEGGDQEQRIGNLAWLLHRSARLFLDIPVTDADGRSYSAADYEAARLRGQQADTEGVTLDQFDTAKRATPPTFYTSLLADLASCEVALHQCEAAVDARLGLEGPSFFAAREALDKVKGMADKLAAEMGVIPLTTASELMKKDAQLKPAPAYSGLKKTHNSPALGATLFSSNEPVQTREQALARLRQVADFFKHTEPHSPVAHLAEKAAKWGEMSLHDWLKTVVKDQAVLTQLEELLGVDSASTDN